MQAKQQIDMLDKKILNEIQWTFPLLDRPYLEISKHHNISEDEIMQAVRILALNPQTIAEPSGAVAPAAWFFHRDTLPASNHTVAVISGGNIDPALLSRVRA